ncbi:hypothetical protein N9401_06825 [Amylibacter sp.]|nr:hypothetical protein [Amylibacter sp.]
MATTTRPPSLAALPQGVITHTAFVTMATTTRPPSLAALRLELLVRMQGKILPAFGTMATTTQLL